MVRIVIRRLATSVTEEDAVARFEFAKRQAEAPKCRVQYFVSGKKSTRRGIVPGRLYIICPEPLESKLTAQLRQVFGSDDADPRTPSVERAPLSKVFREPLRRDKREGTWLKSAAFAESQNPELDATQEEENNNSVSTTSALVDFVNSTKGVFFKGIEKKKKKKPTAQSKAQKKTETNAKQKKKKKEKQQSSGTSSKKKKKTIAPRNKTTPKDSKNINS